MAVEIADKIPSPTNKTEVESFSDYYREELEALSGHHKNRLRDILDKRGYSQEQIELLVPRKVSLIRGYMPKRCDDAIAEALGISGKLPRDRRFWTPARVGAAAKAIAEEYEGQLDGAVCNLTKLRKFFKACGMSKREYANSYIRSLTIERNRRREKRTEARGIEGIVLPDEYEKISDLRARVNNYLRGTTPKLNPLMLADLMVTLCARPGEIYTLRTTKNGVTGVLKKSSERGQSYPIVSALGVDTARRFLDFWNRIPSRAQAEMDEDLEDLVSEWGIQKRDLRAIGCHLAMRANNISTSSATGYSDRMIGVAALRHNPPIKNPVDHYSRVLDDSRSMAAGISELSLRSKQKIRKIIDSELR